MIKIRNEFEFNNWFKINYKKGQMTVWIIIAIVLIAAIILFAFVQNRQPAEKVNVDNPRAQIQKCVRDTVENISDLILHQGGFVNPTNFKMYNNEKVGYLCENSVNSIGCVNQHPALITEISSQFNDYLSPRIQRCFEDLRIALEKRGSTVNLGPLNFKVDILPGKISLNMKRQMTLVSGEKTQTFGDFSQDIPSSIYDLANVAVEIVNDEAVYCDFDYVNYIQLHYGIDVMKDSISDSTKIYTIIDTSNKNRMNIAIKSDRCMNIPLINNAQ